MKKNNENCRKIKEIKKGYYIALELVREPLQYNSPLKLL